MRILIYLGHPAHFHLFKEVIKKLMINSHQIQIVIKKKDVLEQLLNEIGWKYYNVFPKERKDDKISIALSLLKRDYEIFKIAIKTKNDLMIGTSPEITHVGKLLGIPSIVVNEDDADQVPLFAKLAYPLANLVLAPYSCSTGKWENKSVKYNGYHELCYLHPNYFKPDQLIKKKLLGNSENYFIIRFAKLTAHHDTGKTGLTKELTLKIIDKLKHFGVVYISSERDLENEFEGYRINIKASEMLDAISGASIYIGDSQTMAAEAAVLGTPSIRFNDFVGKLGYLEELEHKYGLTYGIKTSEPDQLLSKIDELLSYPNIKEEWAKRREKMLNDKIDVTAFIVWLIENYHESKKIMFENPDYQYNFKSNS
jgi:predicted glycosyltransferase